MKILSVVSLIRWMLGSSVMNKITPESQLEIIRAQASNKLNRRRKMRVNKICLKKGGRVWTIAQNLLPSSLLNLKDNFIGHHRQLLLDRGSNRTRIMFKKVRVDTATLKNSNLTNQQSRTQMKIEPITKRCLTFSLREASPIVNLSTNLQT